MTNGTLTLSIQDYHKAMGKSRRSEAPMRQWTLQYLRTHPRVNKALIFRMNVGGFYSSKNPRTGKWGISLTPSGRKGETYVAFGKKGWSDIWFTLKPHNTLSVFETKREKDKPTKEQVLFMEAIREAGGIAAAVWTPEDVIRALPM